MKLSKEELSLVLDSLKVFILEFVLAGGNLGKLPVFKVLKQFPMLLKMIMS